MVLTFRAMISCFNTKMVHIKKGTASAEELQVMNAELHAVSSASKPLASWAARDGIQQCREACGGEFDQVRI